MMYWRGLKPAVPELAPKLVECVNRLLILNPRVMHRPDPASG